MEGRPGVLVEPLAVATEDVLRVELCERPRREEAQERMHGKPLAGAEEVRRGPECIRDDERPLLGPPETGLPPAGQAHDPEHVER